MNNFFVIQTGDRATVPRPIAKPHKENALGNTPPQAIADDASKIQEALDRALPGKIYGSDIISGAVAQLSMCRADELIRLKALTGLKKQLALYR